MANEMETSSDATIAEPPQSVRLDAGVFRFALLAFVTALLMLLERLAMTSIEGPSPMTRWLVDLLSVVVAIARWSVIVIAVLFVVRSILGRPIASSLQH